MSAVTAGSKEAIFGGPLRARGVTRQKSPGRGDLLAAEAGRTGDRSAALRARAGRWSCILAEERVRACRSWARTGRRRSISWVVSSADRGSRAGGPCRGLGAIIHAKSHLRKHSGPFSRPVIILPEPGAVVRFAACNTCDERGDRRQQGGHVWRPLAREGGDPPKIPRSR